MRQVQIHTGSEAAARVVAIAEGCGGTAVAVVPTSGGGGAERSVVQVNVPNARVGELLESVGDALEDATVVFAPHATLPLSLPLDEVDAHIHDVTRLSTLELVLSSLQSLGSWKTMLAYAAFSGIVAAYGTLLNASYVLVAAMLIAPTGAPAIVCVIGAAIGDARMFARGVARFIASLIVLAVTAFGLGAAYGLDQSTALMEQITSLSLLTALVAVIGGAAGALSQVQAERDNLVTGTATGFLIAVSLSPPAAVLGLSAWLGRWDYAGQMAFVLALTFAGIVVGGWATLRAVGVAHDRVAAGRGAGTPARLLPAAVAVILLALVAWQAQAPASFRKADRARETATVVRRAVERTGLVSLVEANAHFTRTDLPVPGEAVLVDVAVRPVSPESDAALAEHLRRAVADAIEAGLPGVVPFVRVTLVPGPAASAGAR